MAGAVVSVKKHGKLASVPVGVAERDVRKRNEYGTDVPPFTSCGAAMSEEVTKNENVKRNSVDIVE